MPITLTPTGFVVTYARSKAAAFSLFGFVFAALMLAVGADMLFSILDGTVLDGLEVDRRPAWLWGGILIFGGVMLAAIAFWNGRNALFPRAAITVGETGVASSTFLGQRMIAWDDIGSVASLTDGLLLYPADPARAKPVPLQTFLTSVSSNELRLAMAQHQPELFLDDK